MPQLDILTYLAQFFWTILCLFVFYFLVNKAVLPELSRVLKYRSKASILSTSSEKADGLSQQAQENRIGPVSDLSGRSSFLSIYQLAISTSGWALSQARQKRDTFLNGVARGEVVKTGIRSFSSQQGPTSQDSLDFQPTSSKKGGKAGAKAGLHDSSTAFTKSLALGTEISSADLTKSKPLATENTPTKVECTPAKVEDNSSDGEKSSSKVKKSSGKGTKKKGSGTEGGKSTSRTKSEKTLDTETSCTGDHIKFTQQDSKSEEVSSVPKAKRVVKKKQVEVSYTNVEQEESKGVDKPKDSKKDVQKPKKDVQKPKDSKHKDAQKPKDSNKKKGTQKPKDSKESE